MKKVFLILFMVSFAAGGAFAQLEFRLSTGGGVFFTNDFGGGYEALGYYYDKFESFKTPYAGGGGFVFLDATFLELSLGIGGGGGTSNNASAGGIDICLLGKYPKIINEQFTLIALLGITYRSVFSVKVDGKEAGIDLSALWFNFGGGLDYSLTDNLFLRTEISYGFRTENGFEKDMVNMRAREVGPNGEKIYAENLLGHGFEIKFAAGYKFTKSTKMPKK